MGHVKMVEENKIPTKIDMQIQIGKRTGGRVKLIYMEQIKQNIAIRKIIKLKNRTRQDPKRLVWPMIIYIV